MREAREIIRLKFSAGVATREIARRLGIAPSTVRETLKRLSMSGLSWPVAEGSARPNWRRRFTPAGEANAAIGFTPSRIGRRFTAS